MRRAPACGVESLEQSEDLVEVGKGKTLTVQRVGAFPLFTRLGFGPSGQELGCTAPWHSGAIGILAPEFLEGLD